MDEFAPGTAEYEEAHGLYLKRGQFHVVSPGEKAPRRAKRLGSVAHPGIERERIAAGVRPSFSPLHYGIAGSGQGVDISEFQGSTPSGFQFYIPRLLNEANREDSRFRMHVANIDAWGAPRGAYGIIRPGGDAVSWANHFADLLASAPGWAFVPTVDVELGDPGGCRAYCATVVQVLAGRGYPVRMGYYSAGSAYRQQCQDLFDRHWLAAWGSGYPGGAHLHQWQGSPLDRDFCPDYGPISLGGGPAPEVDPLAGISLDDIKGVARQGAIDALKLVLQGDQATINALLSYGTHSVSFLNEPGYERSVMALQYAINQVPVNVSGAGIKLGDAIVALLKKVDPQVVTGAATLVRPDPVNAADLADPEAKARIEALLAQ